MPYKSLYITGNCFNLEKEVNERLRELKPTDEIVSVTQTNRTDNMGGPIAQTLIIYKEGEE